jgi:polyisoprenyl-teichoic acid--peptidoglycan teichoic acid transferase
MHAPEGPRPRARSPFVAAVLSLFFPGLGHAYAGAYQRALGFAALPILMIALGAGVVLRAHPGDLISLVLTPWVLPSVFVLNILALVYRALATVDAYRVTVFLNAVDASGGGRLGRPKLIFNPISIAGLLAVILVMAGGHAVVARYDLIALDALGDQCVFIGDTPSNVNCDTGSAGASESPGVSGPVSAPNGTPTPTVTEPPVQGSALPNVSIPPWDGKERLNILLIGTDQRPKEGTYNTDTLIVVSIDPVTKQVAMFSLPRDTVDVPLPPGPLRNAYARGVYPKKINALFTSVRNRPDLVAGNNRTRGYNGLKQTLGYLYGLDIKYFVEVNFDGFKQVVDALGGVTINVQIPVSDESYPSDSGRLARVYIPAGIQHMTGAEALVYARSRHSGQGDFDRAARQQRVLTSLREQADVGNLIPRIPQLVDAFKATVRTDIPQSELAKLAGLADSVDTRNIRSYVFTPPRYATERLHGDPRGYVILPNVPRIRQAVDDAFSISPQVQDQRDALAQEGASIWVLNGTTKPGQASDIAAYLEYYGLNASAPVQKPDVKPAKTSIVVYNGAETGLQSTVAYLENLFDTKVVLKNDPTARVDIAITTAKNTPSLVPPSGP